MPMSLSSPAMSKGLKAAAALTGAAVGITTALNVSTAKYMSTMGNQSYTLKLAVFMSRMGLGPSLTGQLFSSIPQSGIPLSGAGLPQPGITPFSMLNPSVGGGVALFIVNHVIKMFIGGKYGYSYVSPFITAIAGGLVGGGLIGGLFDPDPSQGGGSSFLSPQYPQLTAPSQQPAAARSQPFLSATGVKLHGR